MAIYSDMNGFPESGFPVLSDVSDRICMNTLYGNPLKPSGFWLDVVGANRLAGALTIAGALTGVTTLAASGTATLSSSTNPLTLSGSDAVLSMTGANAVLSMTGANASIGTQLSRVRNGFFNNLDITRTPTVLGEPVALRADLVRHVPFTASGAINVPSDKTGVVAGDIRYNTTADALEYYNGSVWHDSGSPALISGTESGVAEGNNSVVLSPTNSKYLIKYLIITTTSTNWTLTLYTKDDYATGPLEVITARNGNYNAYLDLPWQDADSTSEIHYGFQSSSGSETHSLTVYATSLR